MIKKIINLTIIPLFIIILLVTWQITVTHYKIPEYIIPSPFVIVKTIINDKEVLYKHILITLEEAMCGLLLSVLFSIIFGCILIQNHILRKITSFIIMVYQVIPFIAIAPIILIWFGFDIYPKIFVVFLVCLFPCLSSFLDGLKSINPELINLMNCLKASKIQIFLKIQLPSSLSNLLSGLKIASTYSINAAIISEWIGANYGIGIYMVRSLSSFRTNALFASVLVIVVLSLIIYKIIEIIEIKLLNGNI